MSYLWHQISSAVPLIVHGDPYLMGLLSVTLRLAAVSTTAAVIIGLPIGVALGLGRFRGRRTLQLLANAGLALPPVVVGVVVLIFILPQGPLGLAADRVHAARDVRGADHPGAPVRDRAHRGGDPGARRRA